MHQHKFLYALAFILLMGSSCKKPKEVYVGNVFEQYFEQNILNSDFIVSYAKDNGVDITAEYDGYVFRLLKNTYYDGPMKATKNGVEYTGTWTSDADYGKLIIAITQPNTPSSFVFINRSWRFTEKALPTMKFAPWGSTADTELYMQRL